MKYFKYSEFNSPDQPGSGSLMKQQFLDRLDKAREISGIPYHINSGFRTKEHNRAVGGSPTSSHLGGYAADIGFKNQKEALMILRGLILAGFKRIGLAKTFIHVDSDPGKREAYWGYD